jgi:hypothetical protein
MLSIDERTAFREMFAQLLRVASTQADGIRRLIDGQCNTSQAKVVDNAIVGYMIAKREAAQKGNEANDT